jgi:4-amino-4-deoxychorismate lyase
MCRLLETIRYENGRFDLLPYHCRRMKYARKVLLGVTDSLELETVLRQAAERINGRPEEHLFKCRVIYDTAIREIQFLPYVLPLICSLRLVEANNIDYSFKYENRQSLQQLFDCRKDADDVLIVKNGLITDTSFCNILFFNGTKWLTPEHPLLQGTRRASLLAAKKIKTAVIRPADLPFFSKVRLINAMIRFEDHLDIPVENIRV